VFLFFKEQPTPSVITCNVSYTLHGYVTSTYMSLTSMTNCGPMSHCIFNY